MEMSNPQMNTITDISETLLIPLYCRAKETQSKDPIINDRKAVEITEKLNKIFVTSTSLLHRRLAEGKIRGTANKKLIVFFLRFEQENLTDTVVSSSAVLQMGLLWNLDVV
jgi:O-methyltransferase involved in polyketide biosynthesis